MAKDKDIRHIDSLTDAQMQKIYHWCGLSPYKDGQKACILYAAGSMYWSGANDKKIVEHFCSLAPEDELKFACFKGLIETIKNGDLTEPEYFKEFCSELPSDIEKLCQEKLLHND